MVGFEGMSSFGICFQDLGCCLINHRIMCVKDPPVYAVNGGSKRF